MSITLVHLVVSYNYLADNQFMSQIESIRQAARQLVRELHLLDGRHCIEGLSFSECHLVTELARLDEATASELADLLVLEKSTMSRLVNGLMDKSLVTASTDPSDRRRRNLVLTTAGLEAANRVHRYARKQVQGALDYLPDIEVSGLINGLECYAGALRYARLGDGIFIRPMRAEDNPAVADIIRDVMTEFGAVGEGYSIEDPEVDDMHGAYPLPRARFWVIEQEGEVLGCGGYAPLADGDADTCELRKMYFRPQLRGLGLGSRLLKLCLDSARDSGFRQCYLETIESMQGAARLYRKHGFEPRSTPLGCTGHTRCNSWMIKTL